ncbi:MAG: hypothetical protein AB7M12_13745, partial [Hyphomonadaceae bacterium]
APPAEADAVIASAGRGGLLRDLMRLAGFRYTALDVFAAEGASLFDLNRHAPGPALAGQFDLALNFGTTEHVFNQYLAHKTIYDLLKVGGIAYHDLPFSGYAAHGYFKYNPLFFRHLAAANGCKIVLERMTAGGDAHPPPGMAGETIGEWRDYGIECAMTRRAAAAFRIGLELSTSLAVEADAIAPAPEAEAAGAPDVRYAAVPLADKDAPPPPDAQRPLPRAARALAARVLAAVRRRLG